MNTATVVDATFGLVLLALLVYVLSLARAVNAHLRDQERPKPRLDPELERQLAEIRARRKKVALGGGRIVGDRIAGDTHETAPPPSRAAVERAGERDTERNPVIDDGRKG